MEKIVESWVRPDPKWKDLVDLLDLDTAAYRITYLSGSGWYVSEAQGFAGATFSYAWPSKEVKERIHCGGALYIRDEPHWVRLSRDTSMRRGGVYKIDEAYVNYVYGGEYYTRGSVSFHAAVAAITESDRREWFRISTRSAKSDLRAEKDKTGTYLYLRDFSEYLPVRHPSLDLTMQNIPKFRHLFINEDGTMVHGCKLHDWACLDMDIELFQLADGCYRRDADRITIHDRVVPAAVNIINSYGYMVYI